MKTWAADCSFIDTVDSAREKGHTIYFTAETADAAFDAAMRWADGRHRLLPEIFGVVGCIKLYAFQPSPIDAEGRYMLPTSFPVREWKYDTLC